MSNLSGVDYYEDGSPKDYSSADNVFSSASAVPSSPWYSNLDGLFSGNGFVDALGGIGTRLLDMHAFETQAEYKLKAQQQSDAAQRQLMRDQTILSLQSGQSFLLPALLIGGAVLIFVVMRRGR